MLRRCTLPSVTLLFALLVLVPGCKKSQPAQVPTDDERERATETRVVPPPRDTRPQAEEVDSGGFAGDDAGGGQFREETISVAELHERLGAVYFAYDSYDLSPTSLATLRENAEVLKAYPDFGVVVEGHCDERGTIDYNLALGEKRAASVRDYLASLGVERERIRIITYGEERPVDTGHSEASWSKNRRAEFIVER